MASRNRGKTKLKLRDLSRHRPTLEETRQIVDALVDSPPIVTAVLGATLIEQELDDLLRARFSRRDDETWKDLTDEKGPLSTFNSKIVAGYAFGIYDQTTQIMT